MASTAAETGEGVASAPEVAAAAATAPPAAAGAGDAGPSDGDATAKHSSRTHKSHKEHKKRKHSHKSSRHHKSSRRDRDRDGRRSKDRSRSRSPVRSRHAAAKHSDKEEEAANGSGDKAASDTEMTAEQKPADEDGKGKGEKSEKSSGEHDKGKSSRHKSSHRDRDRDRDRRRSDRDRDRDRDRRRDHDRHRGSSSRRDRDRHTRDRDRDRRSRRRRSSSRDRRRRRRRSYSSSSSGSSSSGGKKRAGVSVAEVLKMQQASMGMGMPGMGMMGMGMPGMGMMGMPGMMNPMMQQMMMARGMGMPGMGVPGMGPPMGAPPVPTGSAVAAAAAATGDGDSKGDGAGATDGIAPGSGPLVPAVGAGVAATTGKVPSGVSAVPGSAGAGAGNPNVQAILAKVQRAMNTGVVDSMAATKKQRELYVGNLPPGMTGPRLKEVMGAAILQMAANMQPGNPIIQCWMSNDSHYAFVEFRSIEETNAALVLNGIAIGGVQLRIGRPKSYGESQSSATGANQTGMAAPQFVLPSVAAAAAAAANGGGGAPAAPAEPAKPAPLPRLQVSGIPTYLTEAQIKQITAPFGELAGCTLQRDATTNLSKGVAFLQYHDAAASDNALKGLNGLKIGDSTLVVQKARPVEAGASSQFGPMSVVVSLANMVTVDQLGDASVVQEMKEEVGEECGKFGTVVRLAIPTPVEGQDVQGLGNIYVQFDTVDSALNAAHALHGRRFDGRDVGVQFCEVADAPF